MSRKIMVLIAALGLSVGFASCATRVKSEDQGNGTCKQTTTQEFFGWGWGTDENLVNCNP